MARLMNDLTLDRLLECNLTAQAAFVVLGDLEAALRGTPDTALPPQASRRGGRRRGGVAARVPCCSAACCSRACCENAVVYCQALVQMSQPKTSTNTAVAPCCRYGAALAKRCCSRTTPLLCTSFCSRPLMPRGMQLSWGPHLPGCPRRAARRPQTRRALCRAGRATPPGSSSSESAGGWQQQQVCTQLLD